MRSIRVYAICSLRVIEHLRSIAALLRDVNNRDDQLAANQEVIENLMQEIDRLNFMNETEE